MENFLTKIFKKKDDSVIGIDVGSSAIKVVQLRKKAGKAVLETYGALALGPYAGVEIGRSTNLLPDRLAEALIDILRESKTSSKQCVVSIPFRSSLITLIEMPDVGYKQLSQMVPLEARKYIPVPITEVVLDWSSIPKVEDDKKKKDEEELPKPAVPKVEVLVVAIHNETIKGLQALVQKAGLEPGSFEIEIFSTIRSVLNQEPEPTLILDMGASTTKLYIVERGIVRYSHTINKGSQDITLSISQAHSITVEQAEILKRDVGLRSKPGEIVLVDAITQALDYVFSETNRVILSYQKKYLKSISKVVLVGGGSALKGIEDLARDKFKTDIVVGDPFSKIEAPAFLEDVLKRTGPEFAVALGVALRKLQEE